MSLAILPRALACAAVALALSACASITPSSRGAASPETPSVSKAALAGDSATIHVTGLSCPLCAHNIDQQLRQVPGVKSAHVDLGKGEVHVSLAEFPKPSSADLAAAVDRAGFTVVKIETP